MRSGFWASAVLLGVVLMPQAVEGHHGYTAFDTKAEVTFEATVTEFHFTNPHAVIEFDTKQDGQIQKWQVEMGSRRQLTIHGWTPTTIAPGMKLTISGYRAKNGSRAMWATKILGPDGKEIRIVREN